MNGPVPPAEVCPIVVDSGERRSHLPEALVSLGASVRVTRLPAGDYVLGRGVIVERKTVFDLHESVHCGRFWPQLKRLRHTASHPYLAIEGADLDRGRLGCNAIRGVCLAVIEEGVSVIRTADRDDTARWLLLPFRRVQRGASFVPRDRPSYAQLLKRRDDAVPEALLCAIPGISVVTARELLQSFGSVSGVIRASDAALLAVPGVGPARLRALRAAFQ